MQPRPVAAITFLTLSIAALSGSAVATRQNPAPEFDVSSVKPAGPDRTLGEVVRRPPPGQWRAYGVTLQNAIATAYPDFRLPGLIVGGPDWIKETPFDLQGRMNPATTHGDLTLMIRRLLRDRFALRTHVERRTLDVYRLTLKTPGRLGPGLIPAAAACIKWRMIGGAVPEECDIYRRAGGAVESAIPAATIADYITVITMMSMAPPSSRMSGAVDRPVVDRTGLDGFFQFIGPSWMAARGSVGAEAGGSFFTRMEEQLGLKLTPAREPVDVLVIDSVSTPGPD